MRQKGYNNITEVGTQTNFAGKVQASTIKMTTGGGQYKMMISDADGNVSIQSPDLIRSTPAIVDGNGTNLDIEASHANGAGEVGGSIKIEAGSSNSWGGDVQIFPGAGSGEEQRGKIKIGNTSALYVALDFSLLTTVKDITFPDASGTIALSSTIPDYETDPVFSASEAAGITSAHITSLGELGSAVGITDTFTTADGKTVTVTNGIITSIV